MTRILYLWRRFWRSIDLAFTGHWTYCAGCKRFSPQDYCPHCPLDEGK